MKILKPKVELWKQGDDDFAHIARCARVCYASDKTDNNEKLVNNLVKNNHLSMFRHQTIYFKVPSSRNVIERFDNSPYVNIIQYGGFYYISTNGHYFREHSDIFEDIIRYIVDEETFDNTEICREIMRYTFKVVTQISTSREFNRVSPNNIAEQSTRYVYEDGSIVEPHWFTIEPRWFTIKDHDYEYLGKDLDDKSVFKINNNIVDKEHVSIKVINKKGYYDWMIDKYLDGCRDDFKTYRLLVKEGMLRQDARGKLPLDTTTICVYTYTVEEWRHILDLRYYGVTGKPHPNAFIIAYMIRNELKDLGYEFREL